MQNRRGLAPLLAMAVLAAGVPSASAQQGADGAGFATVKGGSPFETISRDVTGDGPAFDLRSPEAFLYTLTNGTAGRGSSAAVVKADVPAGLLGIAGCGQSTSGGVVIDASAMSDVVVDEVFAVASDTLPDGTPVTVRFRVQVSYRGRGWHSNGEACAPESSTHLGSASVDIQTTGTGVRRYRESGVVSRSSCQSEPVFTGLINAQTALPEATLWATGSSEVTLDAVVGGMVDVEIRLEGRCSTSSRFAGQKGRTSYFASLGFGFTFDQDAHLEPTDPQAPPTYVLPGADVITFTYVDPFIPPDPLKDCPVDLNCDDKIDFFDVLEFLALFQAMDEVADWDFDGDFDFFDVLAYLEVFALECLPINPA